MGDNTTTSKTVSNHFIEITSVTLIFRVIEYLKV